MWIQVHMLSISQKKKKRKETHLNNADCCNCIPFNGWRHPSKYDMWAVDLLFPQADLYGYHLPAS